MRESVKRSETAKQRRAVEASSEVTAVSTTDLKVASPDWSGKMQSSRNTQTKNQMELIYHLDKLNWLLHNI